ncbi:MAG: hypothetical protein ABH967_01225 [Patescibacteria group bacterium]
MAITFLEQKKKQEKLLPILVGVLLITALVVWWGYFKKSTSEISTEIEGFEVFLPTSKVEIDFSIFEKPWFDNFEPFEKSPIFEGEKGKENPFIINDIIEE